MATGKLFALNYEPEHTCDVAEQKEYLCLRQPSLLQVNKEQSSFSLVLQRVQNTFSLMLLMVLLGPMAKKQLLSDLCRACATRVLSLMLELCRI